MFGESKVATDLSGFAMTSWPPFAVNTGTGLVSRRFESFPRIDCSNNLVVAHQQNLPFSRLFDGAQARSAH